MLTTSLPLWLVDSPLELAIFLGDTPTEYDFGEQVEASDHSPLMEFVVDFRAPVR